ncbi:MAG: ABC transporter permease [Phycisphaerales bacterium]|nr:ABC transporter permease [Phycisphaerales bacterium]
MADASTIRIAFEEAAGMLTVRLGGRVDAAALAQYWESSAAQLRASTSKAVAIDLSAVDHLDGSGLGLILGLEYLAQHSGTQTTIVGATEAQTRLMEMARRGQDRAAAHEQEGFVQYIGAVTLEVGQFFRALVEFRGELLGMIIATVRNPRLLRVGDTMREMAIVGAHAVPVVALLGFLIGAIIAFQCVEPLSKYGAKLQVADIVGVSILRELGPLITAILVAGRSGAAFAATIGTMKVGQEVDALRTFGIAPMRFLVLPRFVACVCMTPLLAIFANLMGIAGGAVIMMNEGFSFRQYLNEVQQAVHTGSLLQGLIKAGIFGALIAIIGCQRGLATNKEDGARAVGAQTTSAVVSSIVMIILADAVLGAFFYTIGV